ncbi:hypothetical protein [Pseudomonas oryzihabitans]|uniref:DUF3509 domain-containing protein n=1 Tax=Pseudomonas oryzihabitans TaxID=47885 RepID=A0AAJ2BKI9_9PSED|nr:hypothetical protein [Pseudomonas psychrotolerans]MDR6234085.1 hypothetical protein [Pseudomonas psychrotolerans]MDR6356813.1 hypothetical protein [Pseudomonas psychrotolerans]
MEHAIDELITAFSPHSCLAVPRRADRTLLFTITDTARAITVTKAIPLCSLECKTSLATVIKDLQRDLDRAAGTLSSESLADLRQRGPRVQRFDI